MSNKKKQSDHDHLAAPQQDAEAQLASIMNAYLERLEQGDQPSRQELLNDYPHLANQLSQCLDGIDLLHLVNDDVGFKSRPAGDVIAPLATLGDFRIVRPLGRGGMGIVYEAEQLSMNRRVALKVLPFAALLDSRQLQRFKNEARAAGALHHTHIVPVFSVGTERGIHYYAMQYVDGPSLADVLQDLGASVRPTTHSDTEVEPAELHPLSATRRDLQAAISTKHTSYRAEYFRAVALWGSQAADALAYAHENGVLHRDIKPANLLLDGSGKLFVSDFGLARLESEASMTLSGDMMGTLRYMSPEQALGRRDLVDSRADVYSLGVTLYELATMTPAISGNCREEILRKIAAGELVAPRKIDPLIPADLETIILRATSTAREDRYASAEDFADDLRQFLSGQPIRAKRPTIMERTRRWARQHQAATLFGAIVLLLVSLGSLAGLAWSRQKNAELAEMTVEANSALAKESAALALARSAHEQSQQALAAAQLAERHATKNLYLSTMRQAYTDLLQGQTRRFAESMVRFIPGPAEPDLRGWEWHYLSALYHQESQVLLEHVDGVQDVAWHPQEKFVATASGDATVCLWDPTTWTPIATISSHGARAISCQPKSERLAVAHTDGRIRIWDTHLGLVSQEIDIEPSMCRSLAYSPDGTRLAAVIRKNSHAPPTEPTFLGCKVWDTSDFRELWSYEISGALSVSWSPDGRRIACSADSGGNVIAVLDAHTGDSIENITDCQKQIAQVCWSPSGDRIAACEFNYGIKVFDASSYELLHATEVSSVIERIGWSCDGRHLAAGEGRNIVIYDANLNSVETLKGNTGLVTSLAWNPRGDTLVAGATDGVTRIFQLNRAVSAIGARTVCPGILETDDAAAYFSRTGRFLALLDRRNHEAVVRRVSDGIVTKRIEFPPNDPPQQLAWNGDDGWLACLTDQGRKVTLVNIANGNRRSLTGLNSGQVRDMDWNPANSELALAVEVADEGPGRIDIWDSHSGELHRSLSVGKDPVVSVAWDRTGKQLAEVEDAGMTALVRIWDPRTGTVLQNLTGHYRQRGKPVWSPDGRHLAAFEWDGKIAMWDTQQGTLERKLYGHENSVDGVWHPTEQRFLSCGDDGTIRLWDVESGEEILRIDQSCKSLMFGSNGSQLYLLSKTLDIIDLSNAQTSSESDLLAYAALVRFNRGQLKQARELIQQVEPGCPERDFLLRKSFNEYYWKATERHSAIDGSSPEHLLELLNLWNQLVDTRDAPPSNEFGMSTIERLTNLLLQAANQAPLVAQHYEMDVRCFLPAMEQITNSVERYLPDSPLAPGVQDSIREIVSATRRHIDHIRKTGKN